MHLLRQYTSARSPNGGVAETKLRRGWRERWGARHEAASGRIRGRRRRSLRAVVMLRVHPDMLKKFKFGGPNGQQGIEELKKFLSGMGGGGRIITGGGMGGHRGGGGGSPDEPVDFEGVFTRSMRKLQRQVLRNTNRYRRLHGVHTLAEDEQLNRYAQAWALKMAQMDSMQHRRRPLHGENLFMWWSSDLRAPITGRMAVKAWYDEIKQYDYNNPGFRSGTGHFTQLVWKDCRRLGTGVARGRKGTIYIVSVYEPRGNIMGQFAEQVPRPVSGGGGGGGDHKKRWRRKKNDEDEK
uniref:Putative antigen 5 family member n=1 Tax=Rhipicephalus microplus TaxID=6941 RepID=A0A6G5A5X7_RHIMP